LRVFNREASELPSDDLNTVLKVNPGDVEAERVTRKKSDIFEEVTPWQAGGPHVNKPLGKRNEDVQLSMAVIQWKIAAHK
jgi:hypothetical protein